MTNTELIARLRIFETDHKPDGWPAIQMRDVSALLDAIEALEAQAETLRYEFDAVAAIKAERDALQAQLAAAQGQTPVGFVESAVRGAGGFHACLSKGVFLPAGTELYAAPIPQQPAEPAQGVPQWLPIETAPKDGTEILLGGPDGSMTFGFYYYGWHSDAEGVEEWVTHWAPRPAAPQPKEKQ